MKKLLESVSIRYFIALFFVLAAPATFQTTIAQAPPDSVEIERLASLGELWSTIQYFHPYLAYREIDWDSALVAAIPRVRAATDSASYAEAVQSMLDVLNDPATRVVEASLPGKPSEGESAPFSYWTDDSLLVVTLDAKHMMTDFIGYFDKMGALQSELAKVQGLLFDVRSERLTIEDLGLDIYFSAFGLDAALVTEPLVAPGQRRRMHNGYKPQQGSTSGGYYSSFYTIDGQRILPAGAGFDAPVVFLVNETASLPMVALALQQAGKAVILAEGHVADAALVETHSVTLSDGVEVKVRLGELVYPDGTTGFAPDYSIFALGAEDAALQRGLDLLRNFAVHPGDRTAVPSMAAPLPDRTYSDNPYPSLELRALAAFRIWSVIRNFLPYRDLMDDDWDQILRKYLPRLMQAEDTLAYHLAIAEMYAHIKDTHGFISSRILSNHFGIASVPFYVRWIEDRPVVVDFYDEETARTAGVEIGDVIVEIDGENAVERIHRLSRFIAASTPQALMANAATRMLLGPDSSVVQLKLLGSSAVKEAETVLKTSYRSGYTYRSGEVLKLLDENIGYADLDRLTAPEVAEMFERFESTKAIIFDMRGYPNGTAWTIAPYLASEPQAPAAQFSRDLLLGPDEFNRQQFTFVQRIPPPGPHVRQYEGKTVMLIDERTISQAEHTGLFFEAANGTVFIGSHTNGANGDVTNFTVPGGIRLGFSGHSVSHADGRQLQRIGLVPDVEVKPTIEGIRAGRDEVLEAAIEYLKGVLE